MENTTLNMENSTSDIINILENLDKLQTNENSDEIEQTKSEQLEQNKTICRLLNIQLREFYDDIYIPYTFFKDDWNINKILYNNEDILFYNKKYLTKDDEEKFYQVFDKFILLLDEIFFPNSKLLIFLKKWTDMSGSRWKSNGSKSYLKSIITDKKYQFISPAYIANIYCDYSKRYRDNVDKIKSEMENHLDNMIKRIRKEIKEFNNLYNEIVSSYVYEYPLIIDGKNIYVMGFINSIIMAILDFAEKLINLNVYAIHPIINDIIEYYTPLDVINQYDPSENNNKKIFII